MAFNVSGIAAYTNQVSDLVKKMVITGPTLNILTSIQAGIPAGSTQAINILTNTISPAAAACGWSSAGAVAFTQRNIATTALQIHESLCEKTLKAYWVGQVMKPGASVTEEQLGPILAESYVEKVKNYNEYHIWQGNFSGYTGISATYNKWDGFLKVINGEATRVTVLSATTLTAANIVASVETIWLNCPAALRAYGDIALFLSLSDFDLYAGALRTANLYHFDATNAAIEGSWKINYIPGLTVYGVPGLVGAKTFVQNITPWVMTSVSNLVYGTDLLNEEEKLDIWYSKDNDEVRVNINWSSGAQIQFPDLVVCNW